MKQKQVVKKIFRYVFITFTAALYAVGIALFLNPNNLAPGGISGIAIILKKMFPGLPGVGMLILLINIPILAVGIKKFGIKFILSTMYSLIVSSVLIDILPIVFNVNGVTDNKMLASVIGGATFGLGMGLMFRLDTTTGGLDIIVKIIKQKKPHLKTGQIYFLLDVVILAASAMAFKDVEVALYAAIAIYVSMVVMDRAIYGGDEATLVYIISEKRELIARRMMKEVNVGATMIQAKGAYSNETTEVIMCVMKKQTLVKVRNILKQTDSGAFMIVSSANEVFGQGFKDHFKTEI
ncbi:YitT family protein [Eubacterium sp.]|uniref:YitT family protein n=1 Tax=Eubacterium sp. TaxID=142586 RepID=UPI00351FDB18